MGVLCSNVVKSAVKIETDESDLVLHTKIKPMPKERELDRIAFSRSRLIPLEWKDLIGVAGSINKPFAIGGGWEFLRRAVEKIWIRSTPPAAIDLGLVNKKFLSAEGKKLIFVANETERIVVNVGNGFDVKDHMLTGTFNDLPEYEAMWKNVESVFFRKEGVAEASGSTMHEVTLASALIRRQFAELSALSVLADKLDKNADKLAEHQFDTYVESNVIEEAISGYLRMKSLNIEIQQKLERLRDNAHDLGYHLKISESEADPKNPLGVPIPLKPGQLYRLYNYQYEWVTTETRRAWRSVHVGRDFFGNAKDRMEEFDESYQVPHKVTSAAYELVVPDTDPWVEAEEKLRKENFEVFRFERRGMSYISTTGHTLESILEKCQSIPEFREKCAVLLPVYEQTLLRAETLVKYLVFKSPRPGISPVHAPRVYVEEDLQLSTHFRGVEVGELAHTINLAPGERRELVVEKKSSTQFESRRSVSSILDLTETDRIDLSTEMEKESNNSAESYSTRSLSAKASGGNGKFSASVDGSAIESMSVKQFARDLQKLANKASRSVTKQTKQEVRTETSNQSSTSRTESSKISISNINDGRSLNLAFYHLYNTYALKLRLEKLSFTYLSGVEAIAGSGLVLPEVYPVSRLAEMLARVSLDSMPVIPIFDAEKLRAALQTFVFDAIAKNLRDEYFGADSDGQDNKPVRLTAKLPEVTDGVENLYTRVNELVMALESARYDPQINLMPEDEENRALVIGSPGLYLDSFVGARPGTEPYSENMRNAEWAKRLADVRETEARAFQMESLARRSLLVDAGNTVRAEAQSMKILRLIFSSPPLQGAWTLISASQTLETITVTDDKLEQEFPFTTDQKWLSADTLDLVRMVHNETKRTMGFTV